MKYTNEYGLPSALVSAITNDPYTRGSSHISATQLIGPPKIRLLTSRHRDEIVEDVADRVWAIIGSNCHHIIERAGGENSLQEERLYLTVDGPLGTMKISGQTDDYENNVITDWKFTSVWACLNGAKPEWINQLNVYAEMWRSSGFQVDKIQIIAMLRDWSKHKAGKGDYPSKQVVVLKIPLWDHDTARKYIEDRVAIHQEAETLPDDDIPICTPEERWDRPTKYAVVKGQNKGAWRVVDTLEEAEKLKAQIEESSGNEYRIDERPGESVRCMNYCPCHDYCNFYQQLVPF